jgi:hypothetical protein
MFDQLIIERMKMDQRWINRDDDGIDSSMKPVQFNASPVDRFLSILGEIMISLGLKLKERSRTPMSEKAQAPNFLIML